MTGEPHKDESGRQAGTHGWLRRWLLRRRWLWEEEREEEEPERRLLPRRPPPPLLDEPVEADDEAEGDRRRVIPVLCVWCLPPSPSKQAINA